MQIVAKASSAMLSGQVATPRNVSGVTIAPSRMPIIRKQRRATGSGTFIGRPIRAAIATASTEPETSPAGMPRKTKATPPAAATSRVSAVASRSRRGEMAAGIGRFGRPETLKREARAAVRDRRDQCPVQPHAVN